MKLLGPVISFFAAVSLCYSTSCIACPYFFHVNKLKAGKYVNCKSKMSVKQSAMMYFISLAFVSRLAMRSRRLRGQ